jgi:hypothetical protein
MANYSFLTDNINIASTIVASNAAITDRMYANGYFYANGAPLLSNVFSNVTVLGTITSNSIVSNGSISASNVSVTGTITAVTVNVSTITTTSGNVITFPTTSGTIISSNDVGTITSTMLSGNIPNSKLSNSTITINGSTVTLGNNFTLAQLTFGSGVNSSVGTTYNGTTGTTISLDPNVSVTLTGTQTLTNKTITGLANVSTVLDFSGTQYQFGFRNMPQSGTSSGNLALGDSGKHVYVSSGVTVPPNSSVPFEIGAVITVVSNATSLTITQGSGVTLKWANSSSTGNRTLASNGIATLLKVATDTWYIFGLGLT